MFDNQLILAIVPGADRLARQSALGTQTLSSGGAVGVKRLTAIRAHLAGRGLLLGRLWLRGVAGVEPGPEAALERVGVVTLLAEQLRHPGAGVLVESGAVGDDLLVAG